MGIFKEMAARGANYIESDANNFDVWSKLMIDNFGPNVKPFLKEIMQWSLILTQRKAGAQTMKINCWDFKECGKKANGNHTKEHDTCPAFLNSKLDGIHGGTNAGRACWIVAGTKCGSRIKRTFIPTNQSQRCQILLITIIHAPFNCRFFGQAETMLIL